MYVIHVHINGVYFLTWRTGNTRSSGLDPDQICAKRLCPVRKSLLAVSGRSWFRTDSRAFYQHLAIRDDGYLDSLVHHVDGRRS